MKTAEIEKLLVFRPGHLGDTLVALPAFWSLRKTLRSAEITHLYNLDVRNPNYVTPRQVLEDSGQVDKWLEYPYFEGQRFTSRLKSRVELFFKIRRTGFDALAYLVPRGRSLKQIDRDERFFRAAGIRKIIGINYSRKNDFELSVESSSHRVRRESEFLLDSVRSEGFVAQGPNDDDWLCISEKEIAQAEELRRRSFPEARRDRLLAVAPGSKWSSKIWNESRYVKVLSKLTKKQSAFPIFFGGCDEFDLCQRLIQKVGSGFNTAGRQTVRQSAALLKMCCIYLGNDTGTMHLAAAVGTRCVVPFSAVSRNGQWEPLGDGHTFFRGRVDCEGCGLSICPRGNLCLEMIEAGEVYSACAEIFKVRKLSS